MNNRVTTTIKRAVTLSKPLVIKTHTLPRAAELYLADILGAFLAELRLTALTDRLVYCLKELIGNAIKANMKRVYFGTKKLDINDVNQYTEGMRSFREEAFSRLGFYSEQQKALNYFVKLVLHRKESNLFISVINNSELVPTERDRIIRRVQSLLDLRDPIEAYSEVLDFDEGAGLGIATVIVMLKDMGLDRNAFKISCENGETVVELALPL